MENFITKNYINETIRMYNHSVSVTLCKKQNLLLLLLK